MEQTPQPKLVPGKRWGTKKVMVNSGFLEFPSLKVFIRFSAEMTIGAVSIKFRGHPGFLNWMLAWNLDGEPTNGDDEVIR